MVLAIRENMRLCLYMTPDSHMKIWCIQQTLHLFLFFWILMNNPKFSLNFIFWLGSTWGPRSSNWEALIYNITSFFQTWIQLPGQNAKKAEWKKSKTHRCSKPWKQKFKLETFTLPLSDYFRSLVFVKCWCHCNSVNYFLIHPCSHMCNRLVCWHPINWLIYVASVMLV